MLVHPVTSVIGEVPRGAVPRGGGIPMTAGMTRPDIIGYTRCACRPQYDATTHLRDGSARTPMKVVTSDDTPRGGARMPYIRGLLNGTS